MNTPAISLPRWYRAVQLDRVRSLFGGLGFLECLAVLGILCNVTQYLLDVAPRLGLAASVGDLGPMLKEQFLALMLPQPFCALLMNLAPPSGVRRYLQYIGTAALAVLWCLYVEPHGVFSGEWTGGISSHREWLAGVLESATLVALVTVTFAYYRTAAGASDVLASAQIDAVRLDSESQSARLRLLQAQIEPHFLLNTIANVRTLARLEPAAAADLIDNLGRYFAAALPHIRESEARLAEEMRLIDAYLSIYRVRMGTRLSYQIDLPPELAGVRVPTMILMTLVENAIKHGIAPAVEGGFIRVSALHRDSALELKVADSGCGLKPGQGAGSGLTNSRMRLRLHYGERATLHLGRAEPRGVVATVRIPAEAPA